MVNENYIPDRGDLIWLNFSPQSGHEQKGRRPAITISPKIYNSKTGLGLFCPITSQIKNYPFEVEINNSNELTGVILTDQIKSLDWKIRNAEFISKLNQLKLNTVIDKIRLLIET